MDPVRFPSSSAAIAVDPTRAAPSSAAASSETATTEVAATPAQAIAVEDAIPAAIAEMAARLAAQSQIFSAALASGGLDAALRLFGGNTTDSLQTNLLNLFGPDATDKSPLRSGTLAQALGPDFFEAITGQDKAFNLPLLGQSRLLAETLLTASIANQEVASDSDPASLLARLSSLLVAESKPETSAPGIRSFLIASLAGEFLQPAAASVQNFPAQIPSQPIPIHSTAPTETSAGELTITSVTDPKARILGQLDSLEAFARALAPETPGENKPLARLQEVIRQIRQALTGQQNEVAAGSSADIPENLQDPRAIEARAALLRGLTFELDLPKSDRTDSLLKALDDHGVQVERAPEEKSDRVHVKLTIGGEKDSNPRAIDLNHEPKTELASPDKNHKLDPKTDHQAEKAPAPRSAGDPIVNLDRNTENQFKGAPDSLGREHSARRGAEDFLRSDVNPHHAFDVTVPGFIQLTAFYQIHRDAFAGDKEFKPANEPGVRQLLLEYKPVEIIEPGADAPYFANNQDHEIIDVELESV